MKRKRLWYATSISFILLLILNVQVSNAQHDDKDSAVKHLSGSVWVTNNGISLIPSFNLGDPAVMFNFSVGGEKLSFDPQFRFSMDAKPWSFILWWRYQLVKNNKFQFKIGAHPAFSFKEINVIKDGAEMEIIRVRRYLAGELSPTFKLSDKISFTPYYLYAHGVEDDITQHTQYIALQSSFSKLPISKNFNLSLNPQVYYLRMDGLRGFYAASSFTLAKNDFPISASFMMNQKFDSEIAGDDFIWSASLIYSFNNKYDKR